MLPPARLPAHPPSHPPTPECLVASLSHCRADVLADLASPDPECMVASMGLDITETTLSAGG